VYLLFLPPDPAAPLSTIAPRFAVTFTAATASYLTVERPLLRLKRSLART
jgi:peptidoglycan/LPS O-acetylase OafA/YrhL